MSLKAIIAMMIGIVLAVFVSIGMAVWGSNSGPQAAELRPEVVVDRTAPSARNDPMVPVTQDEASRRSTLHQEVSVTREEQQNNSWVAPPVVTDVFNAMSDSDLSKQLFGDNEAYLVEEEEPEPEPEPVVVEPEPEPEPEPQPEPEPVEVDLIDLNMNKYRDKLRLELVRPETDVGVVEVAPVLETQ